MIDYCFLPVSNQVLSMIEHLVTSYTSCIFINDESENVCKLLSSAAAVSWTACCESFLFFFYHTCTLTYKSHWIPACNLRGNHSCDTHWFAWTNSVFVCVCVSMCACLIEVITMNWQCDSVRAPFDVWRTDFMVAMGGRKARICSLSLSVYKWCKGTESDNNLVFLNGKAKYIAQHTLNQTNQKHMDD